MPMTQLTNGSEEAQNQFAFFPAIPLPEAHWGRQVVGVSKR